MYQIVSEIKNAYENEICYFEGLFNDEPIKIRMNKDHARNTRNDDAMEHNLSLVSVNDKTCRVFRKSGNYLQWQIENITCWDEAEEQILEFLFQIEKGY